MSLFICKECGCIENTNLVDRNIDANKEFPNLCVMEMDGFFFDQEERGEVRYLCSECNTGTWHGEFPKEQANDIEKEIASFSKKGFTTPSDHPDGCLTGGFDNYHVDERYKLFVDIFGSDVSSENNLLFRVYIEDMFNFSVSCLEWLRDVKEAYGSLTDDDIKEAMRKSPIRKGISEINSETYRRVILGYGGKKALMATMAGYMAMTGIDLYDAPKSLSHVKKKHWKETQDDADKEKALRKASLKRDIKSLKKQSPVNISLLKQMQQEFKES